MSTKQQIPDEEVTESVLSLLTPKKSELHYYTINDVEYIVVRQDDIIELE